MIGVIAWLVLIAGIAGTAWQWKVGSGRGVQRMIDATMPLSAAAALLTLLTIVIFFAGTEWDEAKLAPVVAMSARAASIGASRPGRRST